ncbi:MAG: PaaI family thioesterase [Cryobacterium sp.]|nr:PaaI family thioesterase [Oligoflexia bacterium]
MTELSPLISELLPPAVPAGEEAWTEVRPFPDTGTKSSFVSGNPNSGAIRVRYFARKGLGDFIGRAWFGPETEGPPGHAHGGSQAALLDEGMGAAAWTAGHPVLAAKLEVNFRKSLPLRTHVEVRANVERIEGKKVFVRGSLVGLDGTVYSESAGLFVVIDTAALLARVKARSENPERP